VLSKILERIIHARIVDFLTEHQLLNPQQFGFRTGHATTHQILRLTEYITESFNLNQYAGAILLDATAAFDTVWTNGLLYKLTMLNFPTGIVRLLKSYLEQRTFHVSVHAARSSTKNVANGTPQGSILGPVLFLLYVNDIPKIGRPLIAQYADDTAAFFRASDLPTLTHHLQRTLDELLTYFHRWRIKINPLKTEAVLFTHRSTRAAPQHRLYIEHQPLEWQIPGTFSRNNSRPPPDVFPAHRQNYPLSPGSNGSPIPAHHSRQQNLPSYKSPASQRIHTTNYHVCRACVDRPHK